jgi:hypothetical protein
MNPEHGKCAGEQRAKPKAPIISVGSSPHCKLTHVLLDAHCATTGLQLTIRLSLKSGQDPSLAARLRACPAQDAVARVESEWDVNQLCFVKEFKNAKGNVHLTAIVDDLPNSLLNNES